MPDIIDCKIVEVSDVMAHPNADTLDLAKAGGWQVVVRKGDWEDGEKGLFIVPDAQLPDDREWAADLLRYTGKQNRVKTVKLRGEFSNGILIKIADVEKEFTDAKIPADRIEHLGPKTLADTLGITHYCPPVPQDLAASGFGLPYGIHKTDEENWESLDVNDRRIGQRALVTKKMDGCSATFIANPDGETWVCGRRFTYKQECSNRYTDVAKPILPKLIAWAKKHGKTIAVRGEITGQGIQSFGINKDSKGPLKFNLFNVMLPEEPDDALRLGHWGQPSHFLEINKELGLNTVPVLGEVVVTQELLEQYQKAPAEDGEGVVLNFVDGHYKAKSMEYYSKIK